MTIILDLPNDLERNLEQAAARAGLPLAEYALKILAANGGALPQAPAPHTGAELLAIWEREGLLGGGPEIGDPVAYARALRERNQNRSHG